MMKLFFVGLLVAVVYSQTADIDPSILETIFDPPITPATVAATTQKKTADIDPSILETIFDPPITPATVAATTQKKVVGGSTQAPAGGNTILINRKKEDEKCQCVPFYLCDSNNVAIDANNPNITGFGDLDERFGEAEDRTCQESVEICCTVPSSRTKPKPKPNTAMVRGCGYRNPKGVGAVFTHASTQFGEFPWVVALLDSRNQSYLGVGVLISPEVVMTGAHIANKYSPGMLKIRAGEWDTQTLNEIFGFEEIQVKKIFIHEDFNNKNLRNNIALLRLESPLQLSEYINTICMPGLDELFDNHKKCIANGWGKDIFGLKGRFAVILKKVEVNVVSWKDCSVLLKKTRLGTHFKLHESFLCAGGEEGEDTCEGDGGAPLACPIGNDRYKLTGLVAWGIGCGQKDVPAVYTNVPKFRNWVDNKMAEMGLPTASYKVTDNN